jgi:hypothetical protein
MTAKKVDEIISGAFADELPFLWAVHEVTDVANKRGSYVVVSHLCFFQ